MSDPQPLCDCHECVLANVDRAPITIPERGKRPAYTLHGVALRRHYEAQDELRATIARLRAEQKLDDGDGR